MIRAYVMDLQLFATEKTEKATPKKRKDVREKGQVFKSHELSSAVMLLLILSVLRLVLPFMIAQMQRVFIKYIDVRPPFDELYSIPGIRMVGVDILIALLLLIAPVSAIALLIGLGINFWQVGFMFTGHALTPKLDRLNPVEGFKKMFSMRTIAELLKSAVKVVLVAIIAWQEYLAVTKSLPSLFVFTPAQSAVFIGNSVFSLSMNVGFGLLALSVLDYFYQWWEYEKGLRMSKQELKDEHKQMEGDPQIRSRIKEKQRQLGLTRMMQQVPAADVVVTNPTHFAVALKYDQAANEAPVVVAKGKDRVALRIKEIAQEHNVSTVENPPLAQALFSSTDIGEAIPADLFQAVAEVLAFVYNLKGKRAV